MGFLISGHVQTSTAAGGTSTTITAGFGSTVTPGNLVTCIFGCYAGSGNVLSSVKDTAGISLFAAASTGLTPGGNGLYLDYGVIPPGAGTGYGVTATWTMNPYSTEMILDEYGFTPGYIPSLAAHTNGSGTGTSATPGSMAWSSIQAGLTVAAYYAEPDQASITLPAGYNARHALIGSRVINCDILNVATSPRIRRPRSRAARAGWPWSPRSRARAPAAWPTRSWGPPPSFIR